MTKRYKTYLLMAATLSLVAACSADHDTAPLPQSGAELHFTAATVGNTPLTRAGAGDTYNNSLPGGSDIGVFIYGYEEAGSAGVDISTSQATDNTTSETWVYRTAGEAVTLSDGSKESNLTLVSTEKHTKAPTFPFKTDGVTPMNRIEVFAVFPNNTSFTPSSTPGYYQFATQLDQTTEDNVKKSDLLTNDKASYTEPQTKGINLQLMLKHRMAKLHVTFVPKSGSDLTSDNMPTKFDVQNVFRAVTITPKSGTVTRDETLAKTTDTAPLKAVTEHSFFIAPQDIEANTTLLKFNIKGSGKFKGIEGCTFAPSAKVSFEAGKSYEITVTVDVDFASITGTIRAWNEETLSYDPVVL